ncbi:xanthine dehydrogenase family protein molybdopterin-binding subunit [Palleronia sediminis]|uniref:Xanthine dehydrogenase family protein molybdopterin-binding subunit n=1 Tax=Palleronia sediminis TaxID=2547833 RepID=A0A4R6AIE9_9RHOB|nr:xanthine dehydrogenase family protein molybdopterin-binding subunit [Palleronia sediminis]TDL81143.1 xanthine dehydrogenase family protein molybdopterin-binding subunit [Palleronia sediminis]
MTQQLKMDEVQPRLLDETGQGVLTTPLDRPEGPLKVTGTAPYAAEPSLPGMAIGVLVGATITRGRAHVDAGSLRDMPGVLGVYTAGMARNPAQGTANAAPVQPEGFVQYHGQPVAVVVAETFEQARDAAIAIRVTYDPEPGAEVDPETASHVDGDPETFGSFDKAFSEAPVRIDATYTTKGHSSAAMEPHAALAAWKDGRLMLRASLQMLKYNRNEIADAVGVDPDKVRVLAPYVGGGFGSKLGIAQEAIAAALAARELGRPVRVVMTRQQVFEMTLRRTETRQRMRLATDRDGHIVALGHEDRVSNLPDEVFSEPVTMATHFLYAGANRRYHHEIARINRPGAGSVRAPGEAVGMLALECAMDELAEAAGLDPIELRLRNIPDEHPETGQTYSARSLAACLKRGAERFGWSARRAPGERREGEWFIGMGVATAARTNSLGESQSRVTLNPDGTALVETDMTDIGTGTYAILGQIAAEMLGLPRDKVTVALGDTDFPPAAGSGGSWGASSSGSSVFLGAKAVRNALAEKLGCPPDELRLQDGIATGGNKRSAIADLLDAPISEVGHIKPGETAETHSSASYGAHFCEVAVNAVTGEVRVRRALGVMAAGRILNEKTAASQVHGGIIWGIGAALTEALEHEPRDGRVVNRDLAEYHVPVNLDVPDVEVEFIEERDDHANPIQSKGIGELGISGAGAAVTNAIYNACGVRVRDYPALPDRIFPHLP